MPALQQITMQDILNRQFEERVSSMSDTDRLNAERDGGIFEYDNEIEK